MGKKHFLLTFICIFVVLLINPAGLRGQTSDNREGQKYDIAVYVWPSYHPDDRAKIFWPDGIRKTLFSSLFRKGVVKNNTDTHPHQPTLITITSWNEWTETSYLMPCTLYGYGYLEAVKKIFVNEK